MANTPKRLGNLSLAIIATEYTLYTAPAATTAVISTVLVCNRAATSATFRISQTSGAGATAVADYLYYDVNLNGNDTFCATLGIVLVASDTIRIYGSATTVNFAAYGVEVT